MKSKTRTFIAPSPFCVAQQKNFIVCVALMVCTTPRKLFSPKRTIFRSGVVDSPVNTLFNEFTLIPSGALFNRPAKSRNVGLRSTVETAVVWTASFAIPGPAQMTGTLLALDHGRLFAVIPRSNSISP